MKISTSLLSAIAYGSFTAVFVLIVTLIADAWQLTGCASEFPCISAYRGIPPGGVLIGATLSALVWNLFYGKIIRSKFLHWFLILISSSITAISIQTVYLVSITHLTNDQILSIYFGEGRISELFGVDLMFKLLVLLLPVTILFANFSIIFERIKNRNAFK